MAIIRALGLLFVFLSSNSLLGQGSYYVQTVAFYNLENLFDTINDPNTADDDWTPEGKHQWTSEKYLKKLENLARILSEIGTPENPESPAIMGVCEIENQEVLEDLIRQPKLIKSHYGIIHFDSSDKRGIDVAFLYKKKVFQPSSYVSIPLKRTAVDGLLGKGKDEKPVFIRNPLLVSGLLDGEEIHFIVNHWPSRLGGKQRSESAREMAGKLNRSIIDSLQKTNPVAKIIVMGDFNDGPNDNSIKKALGTKAKREEASSKLFYNPFEEMHHKGMGTIAYQDTWDIFDQILVSSSLLTKEYSSFQFWKAGICNKPYLVQSEGRFKGYPLRHSQSEVGYSDHFPVFIYLIKTKSMF